MKIRKRRVLRTTFRAASEVAQCEFSRVLHGRNLMRVFFSEARDSHLSNGLGFVESYTPWKKLLGAQGLGLVTCFQFGAKRSSSALVASKSAGVVKNGISGPVTP